MKKILYPILSLVMLFGVTACGDDFFDINKNPNSPTEESITPQLIMPRALHATASRMATSYDYSAHWMGYWARSGTYGPNAEQETYNITTAYQADEWSGWYDILADVDLMERKAKEGGQNYYLGAAKVMKSIGFMYLVDQYNNVPYSKAFDLKGNILPAYDKGEDIYDSLMVELDEAAALFAQASDGAANQGFAESDIMFDGNITKWRKLVNTQRLKLVIRQSEVSTIDHKAVVAKIEAEGAGFLMSGESASVNPGYAEVDGQQNPFYNTYKKSALGATDQYNRANNYVLNKLRTNNDIRYQYYFSKAATPVSGNTYYGYNFGEDLPNTTPYKQANSSDVAGPGLAKSPTQDQWLFTSVESMFLQAEAIQRGWLTGDAQTAFEAAVTESFKWLGTTRVDIITPAVPATPTTPEVPAVTVTRDATYLANEYLETGGLISNWDEAGNKIQLIVMQKYLALVGINNFEAWVDYRRVGVPTDLPLSLAPGRGGNGIPKRLLYPQAEYSYNAANVAKEGTISAQSTTVFWDK